MGSSPRRMLRAGKTPTILGFTHIVVREASRNTIYSGSRLWLPLLSAQAADRR